MPVEIIAEIGVNHDGNFAKACELVRAAKAAGADVAKFQWSIPEEEVSGRADPEQLAMIAGLMLSWYDMRRLADLCRELDIEFMCTAACPNSLAVVVKDFGSKRIKISSDNLTNLLFLRAAVATKRPIILSTGMADFDEINDATAIVCASPIRTVPTLLHCTSAYPCPTEDANLAAIRRLRQLYNLPVGWSDHTTSTTLAGVAVGLGAVVIEKHLTLSTLTPGPDHGASLAPCDFEAMVRTIRLAEVAVGLGDKGPRPCEQKTITASRKSLVALDAVAKGDAWTEKNLGIKRPGTGRPSRDYVRVLGTVAARDYEADELLDDAVPGRGYDEEDAPGNTEAA